MLKSDQQLDLIFKIPCDEIQFMPVIVKSIDTFL